MFTGLVEDKGTLASRAARGPGARLSIATGRALGSKEPFVMGESIAVDGCCLSVVAMSPDGFEMDASAETLARTTLGTLGPGATVNLERATKLGDRLGGHMVTGHVDAVATLVERRPLGDAITLAFELPAALARYVAEKGSICVNGVSLTVNAVAGARFEVAIIPITRSATNLDALVAGAKVNVEVDLLARYVARMLDVAKDSALHGDDPAWIDLLKRAGYV